MKYTKDELDLIEMEYQFIRSRDNRIRAYLNTKSPEQLQFIIDDCRQATAAHPANDKTPEYVRTAQMAGWKLRDIEHKRWRRDAARYNTDRLSVIQIIREQRLAINEWSQEQLKTLLKNLQPIRPSWQLNIKNARAAAYELAHSNPKHPRNAI